MTKLFYVKVSESMASNIIDDYKIYLSNKGLDYYQVSSSFLANNFNQYVFDTYNATFDSNKNNIIFRTEKDMDWFLLNV